METEQQGQVDAPEEVVDETPPDVDTSPEPENDTVNDPIDPEDPKT